jgi:replicative DNA helicase
METYVPPHSKEAEMNVLGSCLLENEILQDVTSKLVEDDFLVPKHRQIYKSILDLNSKGEVVDVVTVSNNDKEIEFAYLAELASSVVTTANALHYCDIVYEKSMLRKIIKASSDVIKSCYEERIEIAEIVGIAEKEILNINRVVSNEIPTIQDSLVSALEQLENRYNRKGKVIGVETGFKALDIESPTKNLVEARDTF